MDKILVSACLIGQKTRYDGGDCEKPYLKDLNRFYDLVPFCPEVEGGLSTPRSPAMIRGQSVKNEEGVDVTSQYNEGAWKALSICELLGIRLAILKERSPSCGVHQIHDGAHEGKIIEGEGFTTRLLRLHGIEVMNEEEGEKFLQREVERRRIKAERKANIQKAKEEAKQETEEKPRKKAFDSKKEGEKKGFGKKRFGDNKKFGDKKRFGDKKPFGEKKSFGGKKFGPKKPYGKGGDKPRSYGGKPRFKKKDNH